LADNVIVTKLKQQDEQGFSLLLEKYGAYVFAITANLARETLSREDIEELAADVFVAVWNNADKLQPGRPLKPYLAQIARNATFSRLRRATAQTVPFDDELLVIAKDNQPDELAFKQEQQEIINEAAASFKEPDQEIFVRFYFYGERAKDIGLRLNLNAATVKTKLHRCRKKIQNLFEERGYRYEDEN
jgi:RNA polymerase sigma-70 factor (ECF subfamily)